MLRRRGGGVAGAGGRRGYRGRIGKGKEIKIIEAKPIPNRFFLNKVRNHLICFNFLKVCFNRVAHSAKMLVAIIEALHLKK